MGLMTVAACGGVVTFWSSAATVSVVVCTCTALMTAPVVLVSVRVTLGGGDPTGGGSGVTWWTVLSCGSSTTWNACGSSTASGCVSLTVTAARSLAGMTICVDVGPTARTGRLV